MAGTLALVCVAGAALSLYQQRRATGQARRLGELENRNRALAEQLRAERSRSTPAIPPQAAEPARGARDLRPRAEAPAGAGVDVAQALRDSLAESNQAVARLEAHVAELEAQLAKITEESQRSAAAEAELKQNLAEATRIVETLQNDMQAQKSRLAGLETANRQLGQEALRSASALSHVLQLAAELQDVNRRREIHLNNILRRYKDLTEQYRALSAAMDSHRERGLPLSESELGRIQNTIAMTEEDLRQINSLNAQATRIQKKLPQK